MDPKLTFCFRNIATIKFELHRSNDVLLFWPALTPTVATAKGARSVKQTRHTAVADWPQVALKGRVCSHSISSLNRLYCTMPALETLQTLGSFEPTC